MINSQTFVTTDGMTVIVDKHEEFTEGGHVIQGFEVTIRPATGFRITDSDGRWKGTQASVELDTIRRIEDDRF